MIWQECAAINTACQLTHWSLTLILIDNYAQQCIHLQYFLGETSESELLKQPHAPNKLHTYQWRCFFFTFQVISFYFHTVPSWGIKDGRARWHLKSAFPSPLRQSVPFPYRQQTPTPSICTAHRHTHIHFPHTFSLPTDNDIPGYSASRVQTTTSGLLNDTSVGLLFDLRSH